MLLYGGSCVKISLPVVHFLGQVAANDNDTDSWNAEVSYSLQFFGPQLPFMIDSQTGIITYGLIDLETFNTFPFVVVARDKGISSNKW